MILHFMIYIQCQLAVPISAVVGPIYSEADCKGVQVGMVGVTSVTFMQKFVTCHLPVIKISIFVA